MNRILHAYLSKVDSRLSGLKRADKRAVMIEIRDHLTDDVARRVADGADEGDAARDAIEAFGEPEDLAFAYGANGGIIDRATGDRILEIAVLTGRSVGRGLGGVAKFLGIAALAIFGAVVLITLGVLLFATVFVTAFDDEISEAIPRPAYDRAGSHDSTDPWFTLETDTFNIPGEARELRVFHSIEEEDFSGDLTITLTDPNGRMYNLGGAGTHTTISSVAGTWEVSYRATGFVGDFRVDVLYHLF